MQRILVYGVTGSGKSTCALVIGDRTGLPVTLVDEIAWNPGWVSTSEAEQRDRISAVVEGERWVLDSAYGIWLDLILPRVDLIVGLDYPRWFSLQRLVRRTVRRVVTKEPVCNGNTELWWRVFTHDSIIVWHFRSFGRKRSRMRDWAKAPDGPPILLFKKPADLEEWLSTLKGEAS